MPITSQEKVGAKIGRKRTKWDEAISDAKRKIRELNFTITVYKQRKKAGDRWPGKSATQN
jgi:hypothetical protein